MAGFCTVRMDNRLRALLALHPFDLIIIPYSSYFNDLGLAAAKPAQCPPPLLTCTPMSAFALSEPSLRQISRGAAGCNLTVSRLRRNQFFIEWNAICRGTERFHVRW